MIQANKGNLLKFNAGDEWQRHAQPGTNTLPFGLRCPKANGLPFQLFFTGGAGVVTWELIDPYGTVEAMDAGDLIVTDKDGGGFWVTRTAFVALTNPVDCGYYYAKVTVDGVHYYSEMMHFIEDDGNTLYRIRFTSSKDKGNVLYTSFSYHQFFYPKSWAWDRPTVNRELDTVVDGNGNETTRFSRTVVRYRLEVSDVPDDCIPFFAKCGDLDGVQFEDFDGSVVVVPMVATSFTSRAQGIGLNIGVFEFDADIEAFNNCQPDFVTA